MKKVSIIIPAYNVEHYIEQCAISVLHQTLSDIEIIFIDDGSTDHTGEILDKIIKGYPNTRVIHQENKGLYKTREIGLSIATGDYIGWVDADDFVDVQMYEILYNTAVKHNSDVVICDYTWFPEKISTKEKWFRAYKGYVDTTFLERNSQPWNKIVKRELMERLNVGAYFVSCFDEIYIRILMQAQNPITLTQTLYHYRVGGKNSMSSAYTDVAHYRRFVEASRNLRNLMLPYCNDQYWKDYFDYRIIYYLLMTMIVAANSGDKESYEENKRELFLMDRRNNQHYAKILKENYGQLRSSAISFVIPMGYIFARLACKIGIR